MKLRSVLAGETVHIFGNDRPTVNVDGPAELRVDDPKWLTVLWPSGKVLAIPVDMITGMSFDLLEG